MCYTSGTTGNPKGVVYSHRSTWLHSTPACRPTPLGASEHDRVLVIVPMFHANAWGMPYTAFLAGTDLIFPERFLQAEPLARMFAELRPTLSLGVPTIWNDLLRYSQSHDVDLSSLTKVTAGGAAVPRALMEAYRDRFGVAMIQGWGMTETSPVCAMAFPPKGVGPDQEMDWRAKTGRILAGVEIRVVDSDGSVLPADGHSVGEFEVTRAVGHGLLLRRARRPTGSTTAGCGRGTWGGSTTGASCRSRTGPRTSSSPAASGSRRSSWRTR